jgi:hypothetical protein
MGMDASGVVPGRLITGKRSVVKERYRNLITGLAASYAAVHGLDGAPAETIVSKMTFDVLRAIRQNPKRFAEKVCGARERMALTEDQYELSRTSSYRTC